MRHKTAAAGIVGLIAGATALVLYTPLRVGQPDARSVLMPSAAPLKSVQAAEVRVPSLPRAAAGRTKAASLRHPAPVFPIRVTAPAFAGAVALRPEPLAARSWEGAVVLPDTPAASVTRLTVAGGSPGSLTRAGLAVGRAFADAGKGIGAAFQRAF
jgi:hypothetical protein